MPVKLFGFFSVNMTQRLSIRFGDGRRGTRVKVKFPWWGIFAGEPVSINSLESDIEDAIDKAGLNLKPTSEAGEVHDPGVTILEAVSGGEKANKPAVVGSAGKEITEKVSLNFAEIKARSFQLISSIMKTKHDTAKGIINNVR